MKWQGLFRWLGFKPQGTLRGAVMNDQPIDDGWQRAWDDRLASLEKGFGKAGDRIATSPIPFYLGGGADVVIFKDHLDGVAYVTASLIGDGGQLKTEIGEYELMMCVREENDWTPSLLSQLCTVHSRNPVAGRRNHGDCAGDA